MIEKIYNDLVVDNEQDGCFYVNFNISEEDLLSLCMSEMFHNNNQPIQLDGEQFTQSDNKGDTCTISDTVPEHKMKDLLSELSKFSLEEKLNLIKDYVFISKISTTSLLSITSLKLDTNK